MYDSMFKLLNLAPLTFSTSAAERNYHYILNIIHPDHNDKESANTITQAVTHAYKTLSDYPRRLYYMDHGTPSSHEPYDNEEAAELARQMNILIAEHEHKKSQAAVVSKEVEPLSQVKLLSQVKPLSQEAKSLFQVNNPHADIFDLFMETCKKAASAMGPEIQPTANESTSNPVLDHERDSDPSPDSGIHEDLSVKGINVEPPGDKVVPCSLSEPSPSPSIGPEVIELDSDSDSEVFDPEKIYAGINPFCRYHGDRDEYFSDVESLISVTKDDTSTVHYNAESCPPSPSDVDHVDASVSIDSKIYVDVGTSPFKPGDHFVFYSLSSSASASSSSINCNTTSAKRNLSFTEEGTTTQLGHAKPGASSTPRDPPKSSGASCDPDYLSGSLPNDDSIVGDPAGKLFIISIISMLKRSDGVRFRVIWGPRGYECMEKKETVIKERQGLRNWLYRLRFEESRRFNAILKFHPEFRAVLEDGKDKNASTIASRKNKTIG